MVAMLDFDGSAEDVTGWKQRDGHGLSGPHPGHTFQYLSKLKEVFSLFSVPAQHLWSHQQQQHLQHQQLLGTLAAPPPCADAMPPCARDQQPGARQAALFDARPSTSYDPEYLESCYEDEPKAAADWRYLAAVQPDVDAHRRLVLVDWLVEVVDEFKLSQPTLFLAVNYVDRYLSRVAVPRTRLQLVGAAALWLACKFEEVYPPTLGDFVDVTQRACSERDLVAAEAALLRELGFTLLVPTAVTFLQLFMPAAAANAADADAYLSAALDDDDGGGGGPHSGEDGVSDGGMSSDTPRCGGYDGCGSSAGGGSSAPRTSTSSSASSSSGFQPGAVVSGGDGGRFTRGARLPRADAPTGPRAAPRYPYAAGSPCPLTAPPPCPRGAKGAAAAAAAVAPLITSTAAALAAGWSNWPAAPQPYPAGAQAFLPAPPPRGVVVPPPALAPGALSEPPRRIAHLAEYLAELSLLTPECLKYPPSIVAAASLQLSCALLGAPPGTRARLAPAAEEAAARFGPGGDDAARRCGEELRRMFVYAATAPRPPAVRFKYALDARSCVADTVVPRWMDDRAR